MTIATDPIDRAEIDSAGGNSAALPLAQSTNGWNGGDFLEHDKLNAVMRSAALWKAWLDQTRAPASELGFRGSMRTSATTFGYGVGAGLLARQVQDDSHLIVLGLYVPLTLARLQYFQLAIYEHDFTASMTEHFYVAADGSIVTQVVALGTPAAPGVGFETLLSVDTDGAGITAEVVGPAFAAQGLVCDTALTLNAPLTVAAPASFTGGNVTLDKTGASTRRLAFTSDNDTSQGWRLNHTSAEALQVQELVPKGGGGAATTILDYGAPGTPTTPATWSRPVRINSAEVVGGINALRVDSSVVQGPGSHFSVAGGGTYALKLTAPGTSYHLALDPTTAGFNVGDQNGAFKLNNGSPGDLQFKDNNGDTRTVHATKGGGLALDSSFSAVAVNNFGAASIYSFNFAFVSGQRYRVRMSFRAGRAAGSTRDVQILCTVGGVGLSYSGQTVLLWQAGGAGQLETQWSEEDVFTAGVSGTLTVQLTLTPVNGAGNLNANYRGLLVEGHYD